MERPVLDENRQKKAREYAQTRRRAGYLESGLSLVWLLIIILTGASARFTGLFSWPEIATAVTYFVVLIAAFELLTFPLSYYRGYILSHRYGISRQGFKSWLADRGKSGALAVTLGAAAIAAVYWLLLSFPGLWWLLAWGLMLAVSVLMSIVAPVVLVPLFYKVRPLPDPELKSRLEQLARKAGAKIRGIFMLDFSSKVTAANAAVMGLGRTRRIVISDTLIKQYTIPEIEVVTAHEIGHHTNRDIFRLFVLQSLVYLVILKLVDVVLLETAAPLGFNMPGDPASLPLIILLFGAFGTLLSPLINSFTRYVENQADGYALKLTDDPQSFIDAMTRLANQNLAVANPPKWEELLMYDHPSYNRRVKQARDYAAGRQRD